MQSKNENQFKGPAFDDFVNRVTAAKIVKNMRERGYQAKLGFWAGFEKGAEKKKKKKPSRISNALLSVGGGATAGLPLAGLTMGAAKLEGSLSSREIGNFSSNVRHARGLDTRVHDVLSHPIGSHYNPNFDAVVVAKKTPASILAHELGHADSFGRFVRKGPGAAQVTSRLLSAHKYAPLAAALPLMTGTEAGEVIAPYAPLALASPLIAEEGRASLKALRDLQRFRGTKAMLKGIPTLGAAWGSYVAGPALAGYIAKRFAKKRKESAG